MAAVEEILVVEVVLVVALQIFTERRPFWLWQKRVCQGGHLAVEGENLVMDEMEEQRIGKK